MLYNSISMRIMGIDPGLAKVGWGIIETSGNSADMIEYGCISTSNKRNFVNRLSDIYKEMGGLVNTYSPEHVAVESLFFSSNAKTAMKVSHARGVILLALDHMNISIYEYTPLQIKQALVGYGRADKEQVQYMVKNFLKLKVIPKPDHASDALAAAICHVNTYRFQEKILRS